MSARRFSLCQVSGNDLFAFIVGLAGLGWLALRPRGSLELSSVSSGRLQATKDLD